jgi:hypothetical protein
LGESGWLAAVSPTAEARPEQGRGGAAAASAGGGEPARWLFTAQQQRLSAAQVGAYSAHVAAAEEADEDFFDNFS